jgi:Spy/CpxP family protein refolding chaperone
MSSQLKPSLLLLLIFVLGIVTGSTLTIGLAPHFAHVPGAAQMKNHWMMRLVQRLKLTADQQAKIQPILADAETKIQALQRDEVEHGSQIIKAANDQISAVLTPDQKAELEKMESEREKLFLSHMHHRGNPHDGPPNPEGMHHHEDDGGGDAPPPPVQTNTAPAPPPDH